MTHLQVDHFILSKVYHTISNAIVIAVTISNVIVIVVNHKLTMLLLLL